MAKLKNVVAILKPKKGERFLFLYDDCSEDALLALLNRWVADRELNFDNRDRRAVRKAMIRQRHERSYKTAAVPGENRMKEYTP